MRTKFLFSILLLLSSFYSNSYSQVYRTSWDNTTERQGWSQYHLGPDSNASWYYTPVAVLFGEVLAHTSPSLSSTNVTDNWIVSPMSNFSAGGSIDSLIFNLSGVSQPTMFDTLGIYLISGSHDPALSPNRQLLKLFDSTAYMQNGGTYQNLAIINIPATPGNSFLAFRYKTMNGQFDALFDAFQLTSNFNNSIFDNQHLKDELNIYPNPGQGMFSILSTERMGDIENVRIFDAKGSAIKVRLSNQILDLSAAPSGVYFVQIKTSRAGLIVKRISIK